MRLTVKVSLIHKLFESLPIAFGLVI
jgi:hypothetical protein